MLLHLNGPPGVGKSTVARGLVVRRSLAFAVDIDELRTRLENWERDPASKQVARAQGFDIARSHLEAGRDVVLPQLLMRDDAIEQIESIAMRAGATFVEVVVVAPRDEIVGRLAHDDTPSHPRNAFSLEELEQQVDHALASLRAHANARPGVQLADLAGMDQGAAVASVASLIDW